MSRLPRFLRSLLTLFAAPSPRRGFLAAVAALAAAVPGFRPGSTMPASNAPLPSAPGDVGKRHRQNTARLRLSLKASILEGMFAEVVTACAGGAVLTGWALHLGCGPFLVGLLASLPFVAQAVQLPAAWITATFGRRPVAVAAVSASRLVLLPLAFLPFAGVSPETSRAVLIAIGLASAVFAVIGNNAWVAWMGDLVPGPVRGRYFGKRTALCTVGATAGSVAAGLLLDGARTRGFAGEALGILAAVAVIAGVITTWLMLRQHEPSADGGKERLDLRSTFAPFRDDRARAYLRYQVAWNLAIGVSAPFFAVHMLENLEMGFTLVALYGAAVAAVRILTAPLWGRALDVVGPRPVLVACSFGISTIPLIWFLPTPAALWPLLLEPLVSGSLWAGHALAAFDLPLDLAPRKSRPAYLAAFAGVGGISFFLASTAGGLLAAALPVRFALGGVEAYALHVLFAISAVGRLGAAVVGVRVTAPGSRRVEDLFDLAGGSLQRVRTAAAGRLGLVRSPAPNPDPARPVP